MAVLNNEVKIFEMLQDGRYRFIDKNKYPHSIYYCELPESVKMKQSIEELEYLVNNTNSREADFQKFFENNPKFIINDEYKEVYPHIILEIESGNLIPDFVLESYENNRLADILELKLPYEKIFIKRKNRIRYSAAVIEAAAQLREYSAFFDESIHRRKIKEKYGLELYCPKMIVVIGRNENISPILAKRASSDLSQLDLKTYDQIIQRMKRKIS